MRHHFGVSLRNAVRKSSLCTVLRRDPSARFVALAALRGDSSYRPFHCFSPRSQTLKIQRCTMRGAASCSPAMHRLRARMSPRNRRPLRMRSLAAPLLALLRLVLLCVRTRRLQLAEEGCPSTHHLVGAAKTRCAWVMRAARSCAMALGCHTLQA